MIDITKAYEILKANKIKYKAPYSFYETAKQLRVTPSELGKLFAKSRRSQRVSENQVAMAFISLSDQEQDFISTGESHD